MFCHGKNYLFASESAAAIAPGKEKKNEKNHYLKSNILTSTWLTLVWTVTPQMVREIALLQGTFLLSSWVWCGYACVWVCVGGCEWQQDHPRDPTESEQFWIPARTAQETDKGCPRSMQNQWQLTHLCPFFISFGDCLNTNLAVSEQSDSLASKRIFCHPDTSSQWHSWCSCSNVSCVSATMIVQKSA